MAQLFTVYFSNYCFEMQEEFTIEFPNAAQLPFKAAVSDKGIPNVRQIIYRNAGYSPEQMRKWADEGLKTGLRITAINKKNLVSDQVVNNAGMSMVNVTDDGHALTQDEIDETIRQNGDSSIKLSKLLIPSQTFLFQQFSEK